MTTETGFIPSHGNYTELLSYKKSLIVYSGTVLFCNRFLNKRDRTVDQMVQAARSGIVCANIMICLVNQCNFLLDRQIRRLERVNITLIIYIIISLLMDIVVDALSYTISLPSSPTKPMSSSEIRTSLPEAAISLKDSSMAFFLFS